MRENKLEKTADKETKKPGFLKRNLKRLGIGAGALLLAGTIGAGYIGLKKEGKPIKGDLDGKIDVEYYRSLAIDNSRITDISQVEDLVAEVHHLNTGKNIEDDLRFTVFNDENAPLRMRIGEKVMGRRLAAYAWKNGDVYLREHDFDTFTEMAFSMTAYKICRSHLEHIGSLSELNVNKKPRTEKRIVDSLVSMMYLDPDLGYDSYVKYFNSNFRYGSLFEEPKNRWQSAAQINLLRCAKDGDMDFRYMYESHQEIKDMIKREIDGRGDDEILDEAFEGILNMFKKRFGKEKGFQEKYEKLRSYFRHGITDIFYSDEGISKEEKLKSIEEKEDFLSQGHSPIIEQNIELSITIDYSRIGDD